MAMLVITRGYLFSLAQKHRLVTCRLQGLDAQGCPSRGAERRCFPAGWHGNRWKLRWKLLENLSMNQEMSRYGGWNGRNQMSGLAEQHVKNGQQRAYRGNLTHRMWQVHMKADRDSSQPLGIKSERFNRIHVEHHLPCSNIIETLMFLQVPNQLSCWKLMGCFVDYFMLGHGIFNVIYTHAKKVNKQKHGKPAAL